MILKYDVVIITNEGAKERTVISKRIWSVTETSLPVWAVPTSKLILGKGIDGDFCWANESAAKKRNITVSITRDNFLFILFPNFASGYQQSLALYHLQWFLFLEMNCNPILLIR